MTATTFLDGRVTLHGGDCLDILKTLPDASIDSVVTDPPYHLTSIVKRFGGKSAAPAKTKQTGAFARSSRGFMGKTWDGGDIAFREELWAEVLRVLKPGGHLAAFSGTRTYHRMAVAIEDAGFEIRDQLAWTYGSGFPKSHDVSKAIDKAAGVEREVLGTIVRAAAGRNDEAQSMGRNYRMGSEQSVTQPATDTARQWQGWGSALKPAWEPICLARKPLDGTIAENVLAHGVGALNIDGCRVAGAKPDTTRGAGGQNGAYSPLGEQGRILDDGRGRFPANLIHDGSPEVLAAFPSAPGQSGAVTGTEPSTGDRYILQRLGGEHAPRLPRGDAGSAARFFYTAKADADDRIGSKHPTVKPVDLMQWLVRLITPKGGTVLDLFAGTGTTGEAAWREGCSAVLIEREAEYQADIARRMELAPRSRDARRAAIAAIKSEPELGPLFHPLDAAE
ncbi:DNA methyltransferase [Aureimonas sp. Leaf324]|uniref:DNA-methyltransferase n=1 Tax=Aureimonas sp. Leaf324 TaxID=1736336 RepID=UPI0006FCE7EA|nr:DNA methyltransferase [Aureimonas sp. Leaf324]KQQ81954.1 hypothetical protein ASF65_07830 [Aureimonas sp. Leaf324]